MNINRLRLLFMLPTTIFVGLYEYLRHYPLHETIEEILPGFSVNIFSVIILMIGVALFSEGFIQYIKKLSNVILNHTKEDAILLEISNELSSLLSRGNNFQSLDNDYILESILKKIRSLIEWDLAGWFLVDNSLDTIYWKAMEGNLTDEYKTYRKSIPKELINKVIEKNKLIQIENFPEEAPGSENNYPTLILEGIKSVVAIPMYYNEIPIGMMVLGSRTKRKIIDYQIQLLNSIGQNVAIIFKNIMLHEEIQYHATQEERCRLAREIHDRLAQDISYLNLKLKSLAKLVNNIGITDSKIKNEINHLKEVAADLFTEARNSIFDLNSVSTGKYNISTILSFYLEQFGSRHELGWQLKVPEVLPSLSTGVEVHLIRIIQEALANVRKHAKATEVVVEIFEHGEAVIIKVKDNGIGFDVEQSKLDSYGLGIMRERVKIIGGKIDMHSIEDVGTTVSIQIPINFGSEGKSND